VTGAASGIGRALAHALAREKVELTLVDRDEEGLETVASELEGARVHTLCFDLAQESAVAACASDVLAGGHALHMLVNNAGTAWYGPTRSMPAEDYERVLAVNLLAPVRLTQRLLPTLLAQDEAHVVNVCSIAGLVALRRLAAYSTSKFGLVGYSEALASEYGRRLGVTAVCPGFVETSMLDTTQASRPPAFVTTRPEIVAAKALRGVRRNRRLVLVSPLARALWWTKRFSPEWLRRALLER
jgi:short-subunit dehydrogenase